MRKQLIALVVLVFATVATHAADRVKVGFVSTLSGPQGAPGIDSRDGFQLAVKLNGGKLGGLPAEVLVSDDQFKPDVARQLFERNVKRDKVDFMTGVVFSNIMFAALPEALDNKVIYISPNAAPSSMAGKDCHPLFFAVSWPNDAYHEAAGAFANQRGLKASVAAPPTSASASPSGPKLVSRSCRPSSSRSGASGSKASMSPAKPRADTRSKKARGVVGCEASNGVPIAERIGR